MQLLFAWFSLTCPQQCSPMGSLSLLIQVASLSSSYCAWFAQNTWLFVALWASAEYSGTDTKTIGCSLLFELAQSTVVLHSYNSIRLTRSSNICITYRYAYKRNQKNSYNLCNSLSSSFFLLHIQFSLLRVSLHMKL